MLAAIAAADTAAQTASIAANTSPYIAPRDQIQSDILHATQHDSPHLHPLLLPTLYLLLSTLLLSHPPFPPPTPLLHYNLLAAFSLTLSRLVTRLANLKHNKAGSGRNDVFKSYQFTNITTFLLYRNLLHDAPLSPSSPPSPSLYLLFLLTLLLRITTHALLSMLSHYTATGQPVSPATCTTMRRWCLVCFVGILTGILASSFAVSQVPWLGTELGIVALDAACALNTVKRVREDGVHAEEVINAENGNGSASLKATAISIMSQKHGLRSESSVSLGNNIRVLVEILTVILYCGVWWTIGFKSSLVDMLLLLSVRTGLINVWNALRTSRRWLRISKDLSNPELFTICEEVSALGDVCCICQHPYTDMTVRLKCGHYLHRVCAHELVRRGGSEAKCPMCRRGVYGGEEEKEDGGAGGEWSESTSVVGQEEAAANNGAPALFRFTTPAWLPGVPPMQFEIRSAGGGGFWSGVWSGALAQNDEERGAFMQDMFPDRTEEEIRAALRGRTVEEAVVLMTG